MGDTTTARQRGRVTTAALVLTTFLGLAGCDENDDHAASSPEPTPSSATPTTTEAPESNETTDTSVQDALDEAGISYALAQRLVALANDAGYGPADTSFAAIMVDTCRDVDSGYATWDELIDQDVAD